MPYTSNITAEKEYEIQAVDSIRMKTAKDISSAVSFKIKYKDPDSIVGYFTGATLGSDNTSVEYSLQSEDINKVGDWKLYAIAVYADLSEKSGKVLNITIVDNF